MQTRFVKRLPRRHRVVRFWMFSYLFIFLVSFVACASAFFGAYYMIENGITQQNKKQLDQIVQAMDRNFYQAKKMMVSIQLDDRLTSLINISGTRTGAQLYNCYEMKQLLNNFCIANDIFKEIGVHLLSSGLLITNNTVCTADLLPYMSEALLSSDDWNAIMAMTLQQPWYSGMSDDGKVYLARRYVNESNRVCYIETTFQWSKLQKSATDFFAENAFLLLVDGNGQIVFDSRGSLGGTLFDETAFQEFVLLSSPSSETGFTYHYLIPHDIYNRERESILTTGLIELCVSLLIGFSCIFLFTKHNYAPITQLLHYIQPNQDLPDVTEYEIIRNNIVNSQQKLLEAQLLQHRKETVYQILSGQFQYSQISEQTLHKLHLTITGSSIHVIVVSFKANAGQGDRFTAMTVREECERMVNKLSELLRASANELICIHLDSHSVMIHTGNGAEVQADIDSAIAQWREWLPEDVEIDSIAIGISRGISSPESLPSAYAQAKECVEHIQTFGRDMVCHHDQLASVNAQDVKIVSDNSMLITAVLNGKADEMHSLMQLLRQMLDKKDSLFDAKYTLYFIYHVSLQIKENLIERNGRYPQVLDNIRDIFSVVSIDRALNVAESIFESTCLAIGSDEEQQGKLSASVRNYIKANYIDPNLNVNTLADAFGMSSSYLSRKFRQETNTSIPDAISQLRVKKAKELLLTTTMNLSDIAEATGFLDNNALIRVFKKYEGVTPGTYRQG